MTTINPTIKLPPDLRRLCGRVATERLRAQEWTMAQELRKATLRRLQAGEPAEMLADELQGAIGDAVRAQSG